MDSDQTFDISLPIGLTQTVDLYLEQEGDCTYSQDPQRENDRSWSCLESNTETSLSQQVKCLDSVLPLANKECVYNLALGSVVIPDESYVNVSWQLTKQLYQYKTFDSRWITISVFVAFRASRPNAHGRRGAEGLAVKYGWRSRSTYGP